MKGPKDMECGKGIRWYLWNTLSKSLMIKTKEKIKALAWIHLFN